MKVKNIMFSGVMAAILTGVACSADAAGYQVASKQYVDARDEAIVAAQEAVDTQQNADIAKKEDAANKVRTKTAYDALDETADKTQLYTSVEVAEAIAQSIATSTTTDVIDRVGTLETDVDALETTVGDAESGLVKDVADLKTADTAMDGRVDTLETDVAGLKTADTAMDGRVDTLETDVGALETAVGNAESGLVKDVADLKTTKQDVLTADSYIDATALADNKVKVVVDGQIAADNTGIVTGDAVYKYALPTPPEECSNTTCVLTTDQNGAPYWMQLWLPGDKEEMPENGSDA